MPKAAFQFGVKMQDGRKTRKQNKDQKLNNELHKINKILARKKAEEGNEDGKSFVDDDGAQPGKKLRIWIILFVLLTIVIILVFSPLWLLSL